jgi:hypothetical protein
MFPGAADMDGQDAPAPFFLNQKSNGLRKIDLTPPTALEIVASIVNVPAKSRSPLEYACH